MYLVDTNIFLEILLDQENSRECKLFLDNNIGSLHISDFSLHSIGVILFRNKKETIFSKFLSDTLSNINLLSLPKDKYKDLPNIKKKTEMDFDDSYQYLLSKHFNLTIVTMDQDFKKIKDLNIQFL